MVLQSNLDGMRLVRWGVSRCQLAMAWSWCWKCFPQRFCRCVDYSLFKVASMWVNLLYVEMCAESFFKWVVWLVLNAWCGCGVFLFNLQSCGYLWREAKSQCMVRLWCAPLQLAVVWVSLERCEILMHGAVASTFFLNGAVAPSYALEK